MGKYWPKANYSPPNLPSLLTFYQSFLSAREKGRRSDIFLNLPFSQRQIQFLFNTCNNNLSHMCFALCCNYFFWVVWIAMPLIFSVLDYLLLVCPATSITIQKTSASPLQKIFFSTSIMLKLLNIFTSEALLTESSSCNKRNRRNYKNSIFVTFCIRLTKFCFL